MDYAFWADVLAVFHTAYVSFVVLGQVAILVGALCRWQWVRNPWFRWTHVVCIGIVAVEAIFNFECPLTTWEEVLRHRAGQTTSGMSFIARWLDTILFLEVDKWVLTACYIGFAVLVLATLWLIPPRRRRQTANNPLFRTATADSTGQPGRHGVQ